MPYRIESVINFCLSVIIDDSENTHKANEQIFDADTLTTMRTPIAIVSMAGIFPKSPSLDVYWRNIIQKNDCISEIPQKRWLVDLNAMYASGYQPDKTWSKRAGLILDFEFDPSDIAVEPALLKALDPMHRMVLQTGRDALLKCDISEKEKKRTGVVLAAIALPTDSSSLVTREILGRAFEEKLWGNPLNPFSPLTRYQGLAARVTSFPGALLCAAFGLGGGSQTLDAACSSSIYAVKLACDQLQQGRNDLMVAGGVSRPECLFTQVGFTQLKALSPSGRCAPFDASADGLVVGEGAGILVLKRLDDALRDGNEILGIIRGIGLSNDIKGNLIAPEGEGQLRAMHAAYQTAGWSPDDIDVMECHAAGTPVGDAVELASMCALWKQTGWKPEQCTIGSVKSVIGHLLTAAGSAGIIKLLLAMQHKTLPTSNHFSKPPENSPLHNSPFCMRTEATEWKRRESCIPRRGAISAFGFGGINAHLLIEENISGKSKPISVVPADLSQPDRSVRDQPIAIVGMDTVLGSCSCLHEFEDLIFSGKSVIGNRPAHRWRDADAIARSYLKDRTITGAFLEAVSVDIGEFHIPPNEIEDLLPQQLLMLKVAARAMRDAGYALRPDTDDRSRTRMGAVMGIGFDHEASNYHLRWNLWNLVRQWRHTRHLTADEARMTQWLDSLKDAAGPPLTSSRTIGSLGSIVASRIAKELQFGGPSFAVSCEEASGLKALEIGVRSLQNNETDAFLVGAVDLCGDVRHIILSDMFRPWSKTGRIQPFDRSADGTLPGEGAVAVVLKRLDQALDENERIYAVIKGFGQASSGDEVQMSPEQVNDSMRHIYARSLNQALDEAGIPSHRIDYYEAHGSGNQNEDAVESAALISVFQDKARQDAGAATRKPLFMGSLKPNVGHTGAAGGLASLAKTALCLYRQTIAPLVNFTAPRPEFGQNPHFCFPGKAVTPPGQCRNLSTACTAAMTTDGNCAHVILESIEVNPETAVTKSVAPESRIEKNQSRRFKPRSHKTNRRITLLLGGKLAVLPPAPQSAQPSLKTPPVIDRGIPAKDLIVPETGTPVPRPTFDSADDHAHKLPAAATAVRMFRSLIAPFTNGIETTTRTHQQFLMLSEDLGRNLANAVEFQNQLYQTLLKSEFGHEVISELKSAPHDKPASVLPPSTTSEIEKPVQAAAFSKEMCHEFATGSVERVLGPRFVVVDTYPVRVRLPDDPLMLVDRIVLVEGEKCSLGAGRIVTEHDVRPHAWYLDGGRAPVCISIEAGQADLFLCSYLGIDHAVQGKRAYRLLDAVTTFHRGLPQPGEIIRYDIKIEKFIRQGKTYLFFFHYDGTINDAPFITMRNGCAGFFTSEEVKNSGGIILTDEDRRPETGKRVSNWRDPVPMQKESYTETAVEALRQGDLEACFGNGFAGITLTESLRLPGGRMHLIDRVLELDPVGGRYGLGRIRAQADIHPDDWFLTCHFVDDKVMPGTLMYQCCEHALRIFTQRMGWVTDKDNVCYEPVSGISSDLKCRGPVTPETRHVVYDVEIKEIGYRPEPYVLADAHMFSDDLRIVLFKDMTLKISGITRQEIESFWQDRRQKAIAVRQAAGDDQHPLVNRSHLLAFAVGRPSDCFGSRYAEFDHDRFIARLPGPPYLFIDRIVSAEPEPWILKPGGWIEARYDVKPDDWYFSANRLPAMPIGILMEIALQPCGWLAAYMGSALRNDRDLKFRNLEGEATLHQEVLPHSGTLTMRARLTRASEAGDMIIESFEMQVMQKDRMIYEGNTTFGFFTSAALQQQIGLRDVALRYQPSAEEMRHNIYAAEPYVFEDLAPLTPDEALSPSSGRNDPYSERPAFPAKAIRMIDRIEVYLPRGGTNQLGFVRGVKIIDPDEWFFKAHFYQDPVCPGSLGIESFVQLIKFVAFTRRPDLAKTHRFRLLSPQKHQWTYRGQILPHNKCVQVDLEVTSISGGSRPIITAGGFLLVDGLCIYKMENFGVQWVPVADEQQ